MSYKDDELLMISGIQHFYYCKRQWYLIHIEQQWSENLYTTKGNIFHEKVDNPFIMETRKDYFISRSLPIASYNLGFYGISDAVEFKVSKTGYYIPSRQKYFSVSPVEYKSGKPKIDDCDKVQLGMQAMCLEEMLDIKIDCGFLYYGKTRHREKVEIDDNLRRNITELSQRMHNIVEFEKVIIPEHGKKCDGCSLKNLCVPKIQKTYSSVNKYIKIKLSER